ncbi:hypothetical protein ACQPZ8_26655 [Actinomadura nitritigenes]|uniref:hypothetical protein n=1 Tax=Actinomadura nitritigenes TaxID=134602 RepID=UPI003D8D83AB
MERDAGVDPARTRGDERMTIRDEYLGLMRGLAGGMAVAVVAVCAVIAAVFLIVS